MASQVSNPSSSLYAVGIGSISTRKIPSDPFTHTRTPTQADVRSESGLFPIGQLWIDTANQNVFALTSLDTVQGQLVATWVSFWAPSLSLGSINGDSGTALPVANSVTIAGTTNEIVTAATGSTITSTIPPTLVAPGSVTARHGDITVTNGNIVKGTAGNKDIYTVVATGISAGNCTAGSVTLSIGAAIVYTAAINGQSYVRLWRQSPGASTRLGELSTPTIGVGSYFGIIAKQPGAANQVEAQDESVVFWEIVN